MKQTMLYFVYFEASTQLLNDQFGINADDNNYPKFLKGEPTPNVLSVMSKAGWEIASAELGIDIHIYIFQKRSLEDVANQP